MTPEREEELLAIAGDLGRRLESVPVPLLTGDGSAAQGISPSCVGNVAAFLASERDMESFRHFVNLLDQLDAIVGQNQKNPKAEHAVLKRELLRLLREQPELDAMEHFYVLRWAQRLLPAKPAHQEGKSDQKDRKKARRDSGVPVAGGGTAGFNQMAAALAKLKQKE